MNAYNFLKFLQDKKGKRIPFPYKLKYYPNDLTKEDWSVPGDINLRYELKYEKTPPPIPENVVIGGSLSLSGPYTQLPNNLTVRKLLDAGRAHLSKIPDNLTVGSLSLTYTLVDNIPNNLKVEHDLYLGSTPLIKRIGSIAKIRQMIEEKGGYVKGKIFHNK